jgi:uncharacterized membrane protein
MYDFVLFLHLLGVALLVGSLSFSLGGFFRAQRAQTTGAIRSALDFVPLEEKLIGPTMLVLLASGLYMVGNGHWGWGTGWVDVAIALFVLMSFLGPVVEGRRIGALLERVKQVPDGPVTPEIEAMRRDPVLTHVAAFGACQVVAFLYLMTNKPSLGGALAAVIAAAVVSLVLGRLALRAPGRGAGAGAVTSEPEPATTAP